MLQRHGFFGPGASFLSTRFTVYRGPKPSGGLGGVEGWGGGFPLATCGRNLGWAQADESFPAKMCVGNAKGSELKSFWVGFLMVLFLGWFKGQEKAACFSGARLPHKNL